MRSPTTKELSKQQLQAKIKSLSKEELEIIAYHSITDYYESPGNETYKFIALFLALSNNS